MKHDFDKIIPNLSDKLISAWDREISFAPLLPFFVFIVLRATLSLAFLLLLLIYLIPVTKLQHPRAPGQLETTSTNSRASLGRGICPYPSARTLSPGPDRPKLLLEHVGSTVIQLWFPRNHTTPFVNSFWCLYSLVKGNNWLISHGFFQEVQLILGLTPLPPDKSPGQYASLISKTQTRNRANEITTCSLTSVTVLNFIWLSCL